MTEKIICNKNNCFHHEVCTKDHTTRQMDYCMSHGYSLYEVEVAEEEKFPYDRICPMCECCDMEVVDYRKCREKKGYVMKDKFTLLLEHLEQYKKNTHTDGIPLSIIIDLMIQVNQQKEKEKSNV